MAKMEGKIRELEAELASSQHLQGDPQALQVGFQESSWQCPWMLHDLARQGESAVARHKHLSVSLPVPYSIALAMIFSLIFSVMGTFLPSFLIKVQRSRTPSGAPLTNIF